MDAHAVRRIAATRGISAAGTGALVIAVALFAPQPATAQTETISEALRTVGAYVENYFSRVQSIVGVERVTVQPIGRDLASDGRPRNLVYELRLDWSRGAAVNVRRDLIRVDGRLPRPRDEPKCMDTAAISPEPLEFLLPENQERFIFVDGGSRTVDGHLVRLISYRTRSQQAATTQWKDGCGSIEPGRESGRVWVDVNSAEVRRLDSGFAGRIDIRVPRDQPWTEGSRDLIFERQDMSIRYRAVRFDNPEETLLLPATIDSLTVIRNATSLRVRHDYSEYRRFVTGGRIVE